MDGPLILRDYQQRYVADLRAAYAAGRRAPICVAPTGAGKTVIAAEIMRCAKGRTLFVAHRGELIDQTVAKLTAAGVTGVRTIRAGQDLGPRDAKIIVASVQTVTDREPIEDVQLVICDEVHHFAARTFRNVPDRYPTAKLLGLTATPCRGDNRPLDLFDAIVTGPSTSRLIELGHLVPIVTYAPSRTLEPRQIADTVHAAYVRHGEGRAVVFCSTVDHARQVATDLGDGVVIHGGMSWADRTAALRSRPRVLCSVAVLTEGWDDPDVATAILTRAPGNVGLYLQMVGRVLRPAHGKRRAVLIDLAGAVHLYGTPEADRTYALDGKAIRTDRIALVQCPACGMVRAATSGACACGFVGKARDLAPRVMDETIGDVGKVAPKPMRSREIVAKWRSVCQRCTAVIRVGERVLWRKGTKPTHVECR